MPLITTTFGKQFAASVGESLLDAALRANVNLGYSCRTGRCSSCKGQLRGGTTEALQAELGLSEAELAAGWILSCVRSATSDVLLEVDDLCKFQLAPVRTLPCRIRALSRLSADVMKVELRLPPANPLDYRSGQYIEVIGHGGLRRSYSIANASVDGTHIELHVRQVPAGAMSDYWFAQAKPNDLLRINGPLGTFFLRDIDGLDLIFLATGTGIAPVKAMLEHLVSVEHQLKPRSVTVYWGGRKPHDLYWRPANTGVEMRFVPVLSQADGDWTGARGYVQQAVLSDRKSLENAIVYACGSDAMIHSARKQLMAAGLSEKRFRSDAFVCSAVN